MKRYQSSHALCPFYHSEDKQKIYCDGITPESSVHLVFSNPAFKGKFETYFCCDNYHECRIAVMLNEMYAEEG